MSVLFGFWLVKPVTAEAPIQLHNYEDGIIKENAIQTTTVSPATLVATRTAPKPSGGLSYSGRTYSKEEVQQLIRTYSEAYGINPEVPLCIARWESGYNQFSKNKSSTASGVFQYLSGTWAGTDEGKAGLSVFDADANVRAAIKYMASRRNTIPWVVHNKCPHL